MQSQLSLVAAQELWGGLHTYRSEGLAPAVTGMQALQTRLHYEGSPSAMTDDIRRSPRSTDDAAGDCLLSCCWGAAR